MDNTQMECRIKELELELSNLKSSKVDVLLQNEILLELAIEKAIPYGISVLMMQENRFM